MLARATLNVSRSSGSDTPQGAAFAARRIGSELLVLRCLALGYSFLYRGTNLALSSRPSRPSPAQPAGQNVHYWLRLCLCLCL